MSRLPEELLLSIIPVNDPLKSMDHLKPYFYPATISTTTIPTVKTVGNVYKLSWSAEDLISDKSYTVIKTVSYRGRSLKDITTHSGFVDRYYLLKGGRVCLMARRIRVDHCPLCSSVVLDNLNGLLFSQQKSCAVSFTSLNHLYQRQKKTYVPSLFSEISLEGWEAAMKDSPSVTENNDLFRANDYLALADLYGFGGWQNYTALTQNLIKVDNVVTQIKAQEHLNQEKGLESSDTIDLELQDWLHRCSSTIITNLTDILCTTSAKNPFSTYITFSTPILFDNSRENRRLPINDMVGSCFNFRSGQWEECYAFDKFPTLVELADDDTYTGHRKLHVVLRRQLDDLVILSLYRGETFVAVMTFSLAKRMIFNFGVMDINVFNGRLSL